jgi:predicted small metal-binding protein
LALNGWPRPLIERTMIAVKQIDCVCGYVVKGDDDDELWEQAQDHLRTDHPDLVGKVSREDILAQAEEI